MPRNTEICASGYHIRAKIYPSQTSDTGEIVRKIVYVTPTVFYAKDHISFTMSYDEASGVQRRITQKGMIETHDLTKNDIHLYDTVEYEGTYYNVEEVIFDDKNHQKGVSARPMLKTIIRLGEILS